MEDPVTKVPSTMAQTTIPQAAIPQATIPRAETPPVSIQHGIGHVETVSRTSPTYTTLTPNADIVNDMFTATGLTEEDFINLQPTEARRGGTGRTFRTSRTSRTGMPSVIPSFNPQESRLRG